MKNKFPPLTLVVIAALLSVATPVRSEHTVLKVTPTGEYSKIDISQCKRADEIWKSGSKEDVMKFVAEVKAAPQKFPPVIFYRISAVLFENGEKDDACFWYYAGELRGRFDAYRCADVSARDGINLLNMTFGDQINRYAMQDIPKLRKLLERVVAWDEKTPYEYDHRWLNLHGMGAIISGLNPNEKTKPMSLPESEWPAIAAKTRARYLESFQEELNEIERQRASRKEPRKEEKP